MNKNTLQLLRKQSQKKKKTGNKLKQKINHSYAKKGLNHAQRLVF